MTWTQFLTEALGLLTGGLTTVASALGSGISSYVQGLLMTGEGASQTMSAFASTIFIFGGISLAFTLGRWILNFCSSLGNRNR